MIAGTQESGRLTEEATGIFRDMFSYTEVSPSGTGVKIVVGGKLSTESKNRKGGIEMYSVGRYFTVTGMHLAGTPATVEERQDALLRLYERVFGEKESKPKQKRIEPQADEPSEQAGPQDPADAEIIARAMRAENGEKFARLWAGDTGEFKSASEADLALCGMLIYWLGPNAAPERVERLFGQSALGQREKWLTRPDYRERTISTALTGQTDFLKETMQTRETKITRFNKIQQEQTGTVYTGGGGGYIYSSTPRRNSASNRHGQ